jgi:hypothetical protein
VGDGEPKLLKRTSIPKPMPSHLGRYNSSNPGIPVSRTELQLSFHLGASAVGQREAEGCVPRVKQRTEVDLMLMMGRTDDFGEISNGAPREPSETSAEATDDPS